MKDQQRAAMQMALELAEEMVRLWTGVGRRPTDVVAALREALAQPFDLEAAVKADIDRDLKELRRELDGEFIRRMAQPQGEWVDLTDDDKSFLLVDCIGPYALTGETMNLLTAFNLGVEQGIAKFKEKNTPPVVPQGEPVACCETFGCTRPCPKYYTTPPSVEAAIEATKEKAAKVCEEYAAVEPFSDFSAGHAKGAANCAAAIRSMK
jgi:hypothetical protein